MFLPGLPSGMKQRNDFARVWIEGCQVSAFVLVADSATESKIIEVGRSTVLSGNNVVDLVRGKAQGFRHTAIFAAAFRTSLDQTAQGGRNTATAHD